MQDFRYLKNTAVLRLADEKCIGCGMCQEVCPHRIFLLQDGKATIIDLDACMECGACVKNCPTEAIYVNPDDGCGCASLIIKSWINKVFGKAPSPGCC